MKSAGVQRLFVAVCRPREGAWIEISTDQTVRFHAYGRPREGAWIEIGSGMRRALTNQLSPPRGGVD